MTTLAAIDWQSTRGGDRRSDLTLVLQEMLALHASGATSKAGALPWGAPIPSFGDLEHAQIATVGINPSNREFVDQQGQELNGDLRRFHTLSSLGLRTWATAAENHVRLIWNTCRTYFSNNPYDIWFRQLDHLLHLSKASFYPRTDTRHLACHLDLIPFATTNKWTDLSLRAKKALMDAAGGSLLRLLEHSQLKILVLNGAAVVKHIQALMNIRLEQRPMGTWALPRRSGNSIPGVAFHGQLTITTRAKTTKDLLVVGYNHNIQSSFGVTSKVRQAIRAWIADQTSGALT